MTSLKAGAILHGKKFEYRIVKILGQGSFGITYLAKILVTGTLGSLDSEILVAVKEFFMRDINGRREETVTTGSKKSVFHNYKRRFIKEAKTLGRLRHPNIVQVLDLFEENNTAYYVMEYLSGGSLDKLITDRNGLSVAESSQLIEQIASALDYMHSNKMLHLDLKPANVMLNKRGNAVLIDFGLTKEFDENGEPESSTTIGHGTPGYAPIEQSNYQSGQGFPVTMDIYALGATLYKMLSGKRPPNASDILNEGSECLNLQSIHNPEVNHVISKAMSPLKSKRFQSVGDFIDALKRPSSDSGTDGWAFPSDTISCLVTMKNHAAIHYFRGTVYKGLTRCETMPFADFLVQYADAMGNSDGMYVSFLRYGDYFKILSALKPYHIDVKRLMRESSYVALYLSSQLTVESGEINVSLYYDNLLSGFTYGDGICEICSNPKIPESECNIYKRHDITSSEELRKALFGGMTILYNIHTGKIRDMLLLDITPFNICFGPKWEVTVPLMIKAGETIPTRKIATFDFAGTDVAAMQIANRIHYIDIITDFGYAPKEIECSVEVGSSLKDIKFDITDKFTGKSKSYHIANLTMEYWNHEYWKEPEWT